MSGEDVASSRVKRMLPSVSEVLKELTARAPVEPDVAFRAAREVCAEELKRIRDAGGASVPLEDLVHRAFLRATGGRPGIPFSPPPAPPPVPVREPVWEPAPVDEAVPVVEAATVVEPVPFFEAPTAVEPMPIFDAAPEAVARPEGPAGDDPFSETTGAMDLRWGPDVREPFTEPHATVPALPAEEPGYAAGVVPGIPEPTVVLPIPEEASPLAFPDAAPVPFALPAEDALVPPLPETAPIMDLRAQAGADGGPGDETLSRLSREAEAMDLNAVFPAARPPAPFALPPEEGRGGPAGSAEAVPPPFEDDEDTVLTVPRGGWSRPDGKGSTPRAVRIVGIVAGLAALAGLGYLLVGLWLERDEAPVPVAVARPRLAASPGSVANPPLAVAVSTPVPEATPSPTVVAVVPATPAPAAIVPRPTVAPTAAAPAPVPLSTAPPAPTVVTAAVPRSRDGLVVTKDRAGQPQVFSIHFTSYKDRPSAERDLRRVSGLVGREGYVAEVDLGEKGTWQRVMIGTFATAEEAKAVRAALAEKGTRDMGWVYRVVGPEAADRR